MRKSELPECPTWLLEARTDNEDVAWYDDRPGTWIIWRGGDWRGGVWRGGVWRGGVWQGGVWQGGVWQGGVWRGGDWQGGVWRGGDWQGGDWRGGVWQGGDWRGGDWRGGDWRGGDWRGGSSTIRTKWSVRGETDGTISIGCKNKTRKEWIAWFAGSEEFSTKRDSWEFRSIHGAFLAWCIWNDTVQQVPVGPSGERVAAEALKTLGGIIKAAAPKRRAQKRRA